MVRGYTIKSCIFKDSNTTVTPQPHVHLSACHQSIQKKKLHIEENSCRWIVFFRWFDVPFQYMCITEQTSKPADLEAAYYSSLLFTTELLHRSRWELNVWGKREHYSLISSSHIFTASLEFWTVHLSVKRFCILITWDIPPCYMYSMKNMVSV